ncbi:hypothetical protein CCACVL1_23715, partial [Corchorus capsularis]
PSSSLAEPSYGDNRCFDFFIFIFLPTLGMMLMLEVDPVQLKPKPKTVPKCFAAETSFFSESADVAPDENSFVLKCDKNRSKIASDQSIRFEGFHDQVNDGIVVSQDVRSSDLSLVDPLCSIVPCSISSENDGFTLDRKGNPGEANAGNGFDSAAELGNENLNVEFVHGTKQAFSTFGGESSVAKVQRRLTSLKTYSTVPHKHDSILGSERLGLNQSTSLHLGLDMNSTRFSDKRSSEKSLAVSLIPDCAIGRDTKENKHTTVVDNSDRGMINNNQNSDKKANDGAQLDQPSCRRSSPLILLQRIRQRLQAASPLVCSSPRKTNGEQAIAQEALVALDSQSSLEYIQSKCNNPFEMQVPSRKRVHFSETEVKGEENKDLYERRSFHKKCSASRPSQRFKSDAQVRDSKRSSTIHFRDQKSFLIFQDVKFMLTGFSREKEKEIEGLIRKYGGIVLVDIPSPSNRGKRCSRHKFQQLPIVLCPKKLQTTKFLYACAVNSLILKVKWLTDSIAAGSALSPRKYMVLSDQPDTRFTRIGKPVRHVNNAYIFDGVGVMLHGKPQFCTKFSKVIQHGGGRVFKTLLWLDQNLDNEKISLAVIVSDDESRASRHLRQCASEKKIPMMPSSWIVRSLYSGKLLPFIEKKDTPLLAVMGRDCPVSDDWSQEI